MSPATPRRDPRLPVTVVGGFLGSGKTTLIGQLIGSLDLEVGVIVNEFGDFGVDGAILERVTGGVIELTRGCLCCAARDDLIAGLVRLGLRGSPPEHILIELSGLADPAPVLQTLLDPDVRAVFSLDGLVTVVDAPAFQETLRAHPEAALQLAYASVVIVNKTDLTTPDVTAEVVRVCGGLNPLARIIPTRRSVVGAAEVIGLGGFDPVTPLRSHAPRHTPGVRSLTLSADEPLDPDAWTHFLMRRILSRPADVLRVKGMLAFRGRAEPVLFQAVRDVFSAEVVPGVPHRGASRIVVIGRELDEPGERRAFAALSSGGEIGDPTAGLAGPV